jgi:hypothetical protein
LQIISGQFDVTDNHKVSHRLLLLFPAALVVVKHKPGGKVGVKHMCLMDTLYVGTMLNDPVCFHINVTDNAKVRYCHLNISTLTTRYLLRLNGHLNPI